MTVQQTLQYRFAPVLLVALLASLTGCMSFESTLTLRADGSGTITERVQLNPAGADMMRSMGSMDPEKEDDTTLFSENDARERAEAQTGVTFASVDMIEDARGATGYEAVYTFDDVNAITAGIDPEQVAPQGVEQNVDDDSDNFFFSDMDLTFTPGAPAELVLRFPSDEDDAAADESPNEMPGPQEDDEADAMMRAMMRDVRFSFAIEIEGTIQETNAQFREDNRITLVDLDFNTLMESNPEQGAALMSQAQGSGSPDDMTPEAMNAYPGFRAETAREVYVRFE